MKERPAWRVALARKHSRVVAAYDAGPVGAGLQIRAAADTGPVELLIYDAIGDDGWGGGIAPAAVVAVLAQAGDRPVVARINSPGGSVFDGFAIYNALKQHAPGVDCVVDGIAASAASFIAMAGAKITMGEQAMMMIHKASTLEYGNSDQMTKTADLLAKIDSQLVGIYATRTGGKPDDIAKAMTDETYMTSAEALAAGFCDAVTGADDKPAKNSGGENITNTLPFEIARARLRAISQ